MKVPLATIWAQSASYLFLRAIHPVNAVRLGQLGHLLHPPEQVLVAAQGLGDVPSIVCSSGGHMLYYYDQLACLRAGPHALELAVQIRNYYRPLAANRQPPIHASRCILI